MEGREAMAMPGSGSFYTHRGLTAAGPGWQPGVHGPPPAMRSLPSPNPTLPVQSSNIVRGSVGSAFQGESRSSVSPQSGINTAGGLGGVMQSEPVKRKRGRPRKYGPDGTVALGLSPMQSPPGSGSGAGPGSVSGSGSVTPTQKRGRGRPPGTGKKQHLASYGEWFSSSAGMGFTPHVITISIGEDVATKILSFSQLGPRAVFILSATGVVSTATLRQPSNSSGTVIYEGRFEILSLSGSFSLPDDGESQTQSCSLSASLSGPDGRVVGGAVAGALVAANPVQVIVGSFSYGGSKIKNKSKSSTEPGADQDPSMVEKQMTLSSPQLNQNLNPVLTGWPGARQLDMRNSHLDIDLTRG